MRSLIRKTRVERGLANGFPAEWASELKSFAQEEEGGFSVELDSPEFKAWCAKWRSLQVELEKKLIDWPKRGPKLWEALHRWALAVDLSKAVGALQNFAEMIPCGDCKKHWLALVAEFPPNRSSNVALFAWTVDMHNKVNQRLGKPIVTLEDAKQRWQNSTVASSAESPQPHHAVQTPVA